MNDEELKFLVSAAKGMLELYEGWKDGIFRRLGIAWIEEPPAVMRLRAAIFEIEKNG